MSCGLPFFAVAGAKKGGRPIFEALWEVRHVKIVTETVTDSFPLTIFSPALAGGVGEENHHADARQERGVNIFVASCFNI